MTHTTRSPAGPRGLIASLILMSLAAACPVAPARAEVCADAWELKEGSTAALYPDTSASYIIYRFHHDPGVAVRVRGEFELARFMSFTLYEDTTGKLVNKIPDTGMIPDPGSENPYLPGADRGAEPRFYTTWIAQAGTAAAQQRNALVVQGDHPLISLFIRVYLPDGGVGSLDPAGFPVVEAVDAQTLEPVACPEPHRENGSSVGSGVTGFPAITGEVSFYGAPGAENAYPSYDTTYLFSLISPSQGDAAVLHFRPPSFPDTAGAGDPITGEEDVRYWSLCLCRLFETTTSACVPDYLAPAGADGLVRVVLAADTLPNRRAARRGGYALLPWGPGEPFPALLYRNMLIHPDFEFGADSVAPYDSALPDEEQAAQQFIGEYAPVGVQCTAAQFRADYCGQGSGR